MITQPTHVHTCINVQNNELITKPQIAKPKSLNINETITIPDAHDKT